MKSQQVQGRLFRFDLKFCRGGGIWDEGERGYNQCTALLAEREREKKKKTMREEGKFGLGRTGAHFMRVRVCVFVGDGGWRRGRKGVRRPLVDVDVGIKMFFFLPELPV